MPLGKIYRRFNIPRYVEAAVLVSLGGGLFGLDTGTIGPITAMPQFATSLGALSSTLHGLVVSTILIPAAFSSIFGGHLANSVGRPRAIALGAGVFGVGAALEAASVKLAMLIVGRAIKGVGEGLFLSTVVVYITELSPPKYRGTLASIPQLITVFGLCTGYFICYGSVKIGSSISWRLPFALQALLAFLFTISTLLFAPQSPRWLTSCGKHREALEVWDALGVGAAEREKTEEISSDDLPKPIEMKDILCVFHRGARKQTFIGVFLMGMQQLSGIDGVLYYAPLLFQAAGLTSSTASFLASGVSALLMFLVTVPATLMADRWGRMTSTVVGGIAQGTCMLIMGILYASNSVHATYGIARWVVIVMIFLFAIIFSATWAIGFRVYVSEIQSPKTRAGAASLSLTANWTMNWIVAFTTPIFLAHSTFGVYFLFGGASILVAIICIFFLPETRGKSLEEIDGYFRRHHVHNSATVLELEEMGGSSERDLPIEYGKGERVAVNASACSSSRGMNS